jgi:membrane protein implicated in regulation of membrane protease activity
MSSRKDPVFRKAVIPWYRSSQIYIFAIVFMLLVFLFGIAGISVAYNGYIWVPVVLVAMSTFMVISTICRLIKRYTTRSSKDSLLNN